MVRSRRLELPRPFGHNDLNVARLPVPPRPHISWRSLQKARLAGGASSKASCPMQRPICASRIGTLVRVTVTIPLRFALSPADGRSDTPPCSDDAASRRAAQRGADGCERAAGERPCQREDRATVPPYRRKCRDGDAARRGAATHGATDRCRRDRPSGTDRHLRIEIRLRDRRATGSAFPRPPARRLPRC